MNSPDSRSSCCSAFVSWMTWVSSSGANDAHISSFP